VTEGRIPSLHLVPLDEIIGEACGRSPACRSVRNHFFRLIREFGNEHRILTEIPGGELRRAAPERIVVGVERARRGQVRVSPGYDGKYGRIRIFDETTGKKAGSFLDIRGRCFYILSRGDCGGD
jgi:PHP family Zn ribbon phosphoesterase